MDNTLFKGKLVRLVAQNPETDAETATNWNKDSVYKRLLEVRPVTPPTVKDARERYESPRGEQFFPFGVRALENDKLIGFILLMHVNYVHREAWVGIGMGDPDYRGKGYGSDAMKVILRYAFQELGLHRVSLDTLASNERAIRSYEKCGFVHEGRVHHAELRDGKRDDLVTMGILRREWEARTAGGM